MHRRFATIWLCAALLCACGGGGSSYDTPAVVPTTPQPEAGAPTASGNIPQDGRNWINFRRAQLGIAVLADNALVDLAAQHHADYLRLNDLVSHDEISGKPGFTGSNLLERLRSAGYSFGNAGYAYGEVISASASQSGFFLSEELITAIYHRFVIFEPKFKELGAGAATNGSGYTYFTADFTANNGTGPGLGRGAVVVWPFAGQTGVTPNFFSDYESPDPVAGSNEVGYPVSVHADIDAVLSVAEFALRPRGGADLAVKLLTHAGDAATPAAAAAIVPLAPLKPGTVYEARFSGKADGSAVLRNWSFTTK
ncbi:MAG: CAP domain-containing protein [Pseudomonadota bacterium]